jgi:hypothetical protein
LEGAGSGGLGDHEHDSRSSKNGSKLPLKPIHFGGSIALKVLGQFKLQIPLHLATQVQVRRSLFSRRQTNIITSLAYFGSTKRRLLNNS